MNIQKDLIILKLRISVRKRRLHRFLLPIGIFYDHIFVISITQLMYDIDGSVLGYPDDYLAKLMSGYKNMQTKFDDAINEVYS